MKYQLLLPVILGALAVSAQTPETLQTFRVEYRLDFGEQTANVLGTDLAAQVLAGEREVRQQVVLDAPAKRMTIRTFSVATGPPNVTELRDAQTAELENYRVDVKDISIAERAFTFTGTVSANPRVFLTPVLEGDPWSFNASWWGTTSPTFRLIYINYVGTSAYVSGGFGKFEYSSKPNRAPVIVIAPVSDTFVPEARLDASGTSDPDNEPLTFFWTAGRGRASIGGADTSTPRVQFNSGSGRYDITLTVTDARGASAEKTVSIYYYGR